MDSKTLEKHVRYFERHLVYFPSPFQAYDSSHTSLVFFCLLGLQLLGRPVPPEFEKWVWDRYTTGGFKGSLTHGEGDFNFASTYFCLCILAMTRSGLKPGVKAEIRRSALACQLTDGSFVGGLYKGQTSSEPSMRHTYSVLGSLYLLGESIDTSRTVQYVLSCQNYDGGFGDYPGSESHAGLTYCALGALEFAQHKLTDSQRQAVTIYLLRCQQTNGGFNGRVNKVTDTCYSFWVGASLKILGVPCINTATAIEYLLDQQHMIGGLSKTKGDMPDPLHSALGICALSIFGCRSIAPVDALLCIPLDTSAFASTFHTAK